MVYSSSCKKENQLSIDLRYFNEPGIPNQDSILTGLKWVFSYLGAALDSGSVENGIHFLDKDRIHLELEHLGYSEKALNVWRQLLRVMKKSEAYQIHRSIDIGRFVMLTLNSSYHYYALTGVEPTLAAFKKKYKIRKKPIVFAEGESCIANGERWVYMAMPAKHLDQIGYLAEEGTGSQKANNFKVTDTEVFSFMPNGQPRFAIYDDQGQLKTSVPTHLGQAGKPANCAWCHESKIQSSFINSAEKPHIEKFKTQITKRRNQIKRLRAKIVNELDFSKQQDHSLGEFLYLLFMEPSAERLAFEWQENIEVVKEKLVGIQSHRIEEFRNFDFGDRYHRELVKHLAPFKVLRTPEVARDFAEYEPDFLNE